MIESSQWFLLINEAGDQAWQDLVARVLAPRGSLEVASEGQLERYLGERRYHLIIVDATVVSDMANLIRTLRRRQPGARIVVITASPTWARAREAFLLGAVDYTIKSRTYEDLAAVLWAALDKPVPPGEA